MSASSVEEGSYQIADHVVEKAVALDAVDQQVVFFSPFGRKDGADVVGRDIGFGLARGEVGIGGGEGCEVVFSEDEGGGAAHFFHIQRPGKRVDVARGPG